MNFTGANGDEYEYTYEWAEKPKQASIGRDVLQWWGKFMEDVITLWKMGVGLVTRIQLADILETIQGLKLADIQGRDCGGT